MDRQMSNCCLAPRRPVHLSLIVLGLALAGCGDDGGGPSAVEGPYLMTFGAQNRVFSLEADSAQLTCRPKPGLSEFEVNASGLGDGASSFKLVLKDYSATKTSYDIGYEIGKPLHVVDVVIGGGYAYKFFQSFRTDNNQAFNSHCNVELVGAEKGNLTRYKGSLYCVMLWSDTSSKDYSSNILNNYIDVAAKFECEY